MLSGGSAKRRRNPRLKTRAAPAPARTKEQVEPARKPTGRYEIPSPTLLDEVSANRSGVSKEILLENAKLLEGALGNFDVASKVVEVSPGPVVTRYEVEPAPGVKVNRIASLSDDLARVMSAKGIRIQAPVPGKSRGGGGDCQSGAGDGVFARDPRRRGVQSVGFQAGPWRWARRFRASRVRRIWLRCPIYWSPVPPEPAKSVCLNSLICSILFKGHAGRSALYHGSIPR